ncbi:hypothetical protein Bbelb_441270, partial [Branchiostoma belcheri]
RPAAVMWPDRPANDGSWGRGARADLTNEQIVWARTSRCGEDGCSTSSCLVSDLVFTGIRLWITQTCGEIPKETSRLLSRAVQSASPVNQTPHVGRSTLQPSLDISEEFAASIFISDNSQTTGHISCGAPGGHVTCRCPLTIMTGATTSACPASLSADPGALRED